jgi:hypothetical protein
MSISQDMRDYWMSDMGRAGERCVDRISFSGTQNFITVGVCLPQYSCSDSLFLCLADSNPRVELGLTPMHVSCEPHKPSAAQAAAQAFCGPLLGGVRITIWNRTPGCASSLRYPSREICNLHLASHCINRAILLIFWTSLYIFRER